MSTRPSKRVNPTRIHTKRDGKGRLKSFRKNVTTSDDSHTIATEMDFVLLRNGGANDIRVNFKNANLADDYWLLQPGESIPSAIAVSKNDKINYKSMGGPSKLEIILWA